ncbi:hypothetical protein C8R45DRAFT_98312 [Mycena sanguinolenta]|nr:hypothetical protein C8R45DRAFT_98312 [Mycena sanguinolenta]
MSSPAQKSLVSVAAGDSFRDVVPIINQFVFGLVAQTFVFGAYFLLICLSIRMLRKRGLKAWDNRAMLMIILFMCLLAAGYWTSSVVFTADLLRAHVNVAAVIISGRDEVIQWLPLFNAIAMTNFIVSDGVVIWKARAICQHQLKKYLWISMGFLVLAAIALVLTISFIMVLENETKSISLHLRLVQALALGLSLLSTLSATAVLVVTARRNRGTFNVHFESEENTTRSGHLTLATKVGLLYSLLTLLALVSAFIPLRHGGVLAEIYYPISFYIASAYPPTIVLLAETTREATFSDAAPGRSSSNNSTLYGSGNGSSIICQVGSITGPDIIHPLSKTLSASSKMSTPKHSRFSDNSLDARRIV